MALQRKILLGISKLIDQLKLSMLPSGTVCWFYLTEVPYGWGLCNGRYYSKDGSESSDIPTETCTIGTPELIGRYPLGSISDIGGTVNAGLPNIKGKLISEDGGYPYTPYATGYKGENKQTYAHGALYVDSSNVPTGLGGIDATNRDRADGWLCFDASRSNDVYGNSETVTPPSTKLLPCMKL